MKLKKNNFVLSICVYGASFAIVVLLYVAYCIHVSNLCNAYLWYESFKFAYITFASFFTTQSYFEFFVKLIDVYPKNYYHFNGFILGIYSILMGKFTYCYLIFFNLLLLLCAMFHFVKVVGQDISDNEKDIMFAGLIWITPALLYISRTGQNFFYGAIYIFLSYYYLINAQKGKKTSSLGHFSYLLLFFS